MAKKQENKWLQIGNFLLGVDKNTHGAYVVLKAVSGQWSVRWKDDCLMFAMMLNLMNKATDDNNVKEYLHSLITVMFVTTSYTHDLIALATKNEMPVCEGIVKLIAEQNDYEESLKEQPTEEDDKKALEEVGEMTEVEQELEKLDNENGAE